MRPTTASSSAPRGAATPAAARLRPQSAGVDVGSSPFTKPPNDKANTSSDELIKDLEAKVRKVVEQKRAESDKLRFAVAKKRDDVEKAKLLLQDLLKDSGALGLHYDLSEHGADGPQRNQQRRSEASHDHGKDADDDDAHDSSHDEDAERLQPIASISRRPVYSKHTNIRELEAKIERRAKEAHLVQRRTLVLEHIKKRLQSERFDVAQSTNQLKQVFADLTHETHELQKRDMAAAEAVSQVQARLTQQKADMAASARKFRRELALRQKWAREKAKFERYYNDQLEAAMTKASQVRAHGSDAVHHHHHQHQHQLQLHVATPAAHAAPRGGASSPDRSTGILKRRRSSNPQLLEDQAHEDAAEARCREAFQRIGVDPHVDAIDPEEIIHICLSHEELRTELDAKHDEAVERIAQLREHISKARSLAREDVPLSKRGTSQKIETKQLEISSVERQLATVVDQYMFVENAVRPIKIGLQQVLQNVSSATVNVDNMAALEKCLVDSCEEMMRLLRVASPPLPTEPEDLSNASISGSIPEDEAIGNHDDKAIRTHTGQSRSPARPARPVATAPTKESPTRTSTGTPAIDSLENFTSPYNVRITAKKSERYFVPGLTKPSSAVARAVDDDDAEENDFDVMDRAMVKRISSVVVCTSEGKKPKSKAQETEDAARAASMGSHQQHQSPSHRHSHNR